MRADVVIHSPSFSAGRCQVHERAIGSTAMRRLGRAPFFAGTLLLPMSEGRSNDARQGHRDGSTTDCRQRAETSVTLQSARVNLRRVAQPAFRTRGLPPSLPHCTRLDDFRTACVAMAAKTVANQARHGIPPGSWPVELLGAGCRRMR